MQQSITPFADRTDKALFEIKESLERNIAIIDGKYSAPNPKFKNRPFSHMREAWTKSINAIETELNLRSK